MAAKTAVDPEWAATSTQRKKDYEKVAKYQGQKKEEKEYVQLPSKLEKNTGRPGLRAPKYHPYEQRSFAANTSTTIDWEERKVQKLEHPNDGYIDPLMDETMVQFTALAREFRRDLTEVGPSMLWHLLPAVLETIQNTPWAHYMANRAADQEPLILFVNFTFGDRGHNLTINQKKFRMVILGRVKTVMLDFFRKYFSSESIELVYSKKFFDGIVE